MSLPALAPAADTRSITERVNVLIRAYNEGLQLARGEFIGVFDADDYALDPQALARQVALFDANPSVGLVYSAFDD